MKAMHGRLMQLTRPPHEDHLPTWSPDSRTVVFQRDTSGSGTPGPTTLMAADIVTGAERVIYRLPSWRPVLALPTSYRTGS